MISLLAPRLKKNWPGHGFEQSAESLVAEEVIQNVLKKGILIAETSYSAFRERAGGLMAVREIRQRRRRMMNRHSDCCFPKEKALAYYQGWYRLFPGGGGQYWADLILHVLYMVSLDLLSFLGWGCLPEWRFLLWSLGWNVWTQVIKKKALEGWANQNLYSDI